MVKNFSKRIIATVCTLSMTAGLFAINSGTTAAAAGIKGSQKSEGTKKEFPLYIADTESNEDIELYFFDKSNSVPYISVKDTGYLLKQIGDYLGYPDKYDFEYSEEGSKATLTRETDYSMIVDADKDTINFLDYDAFMMPPNSVRLIDMLGEFEENDEGTTELFMHSDYAYERYGDEITLNLSDYDIDIVRTDKGCFLPLATVGDFLVSPTYLNILYNEESVIIMPYMGFMDDDDNITRLGELYYTGYNEELSEEMAAFSYNELCLAMDHLYGLKDIHGIKDFDTLFDNTGIKEGMLSTDPNDVDNALNELLTLHIDDLHTVFLAPTYTNGKTEFEEAEGSADLIYNMFEEKFGAVRERYYPKGVPFYEEIGNTAYITLDSFTPAVPGLDYYRKKPTETSEDTIGIMLYSFSQITRKNSPVKNVVLDLSMNVGGNIQSANFVVGMFLGLGRYSIRNTMTGALTTDFFYVDSNLDHKYNEKDYLSDYNLYCIESPLSFSCGNFVPCIFKSSHMVTLLGQTSGGGSCAVLPMTSAAGQIFQMSSPYQLSFVKNGSFYDIDRGAEPDYYISNPDNYYDRKKLTDYINSLY